MPHRPIFTRVLHELMHKASVSEANLIKQVPESARLVKNILNGRGRLPDDLAPWCEAMRASPADKRRLEDAAALYKLPVQDQQRFVSMFQDDTHIAAIRGTMVLADQVYCDAFSGKWIVAGTYSRYHFSGDELSLSCLTFYLRLQVERTGRHEARMSAVDRAASPSDPKLWSFDFELNIPDEGLPVFESRIVVPGPRIAAPVPQKDRKPGELYLMRTSIWLRVDRTEVASCPLDFIILPPRSQGSPNEKPDDDSPANQGE